MLSLYEAIVVHAVASDFPTFSIPLFFLIYAVHAYIQHVLINALHLLNCIEKI